MSAESAGVPGGSRILVLEDSFLIGSSLKFMLERFGHEVIGPVATLADAWGVLDHERFDAGLLDVNVSGGSSYPIAESLLQRGCPVVFVTGYEEDESMPDSLRSTPHVRKPIDSATLEGALVEAFAARAGDS